MHGLTSHWGSIPRRSTKIEIMEAKVRFFRQDGKWYADMPNHSLEENEMVMGTDIALDFFSKGKNEVTVLVSDEQEKSEQSLLNLKMKSHNEEGAYYTVSGRLLANFLDFAEDIFCCKYEPEVWICNVTHDLFGEHPKYICILGIE